MKRLASYFFATAWALEDGVYAAAETIALRHAFGEKLSGQDIQAAIGRPAPGRADSEQHYEVRGNVAIIPIGGVIDKHAQNLNAICMERGTSTEEIQKDLRTALADPAVDTILFQIESPGGSIMGLKEAADAIRAAGEQKRTVAFYDGMACSAALWLGAQCKEVYASDTAIVGSIGVYSSMVDSYRWAEDQGLRVHKLTTGKFKGAGLPGTIITPEQVAEGQKRVDRYFGMFIEAVMIGCEMSRDAVKAIADGRTFVGQDSVDVGLVDGLTTLDALLADLAAGDTSADEAPGGSNSAPSTDPAPTPPVVLPAANGGTSIAGAPPASTGGTPATKKAPIMKLSMAVAMALVASYPAHAALVQERAAKAEKDDSITDHSLKADVLEAEVSRLKTEAGTTATAHAAALQVEKDKAAKAATDLAALQTKYDALAAIGGGADKGVQGGPGTTSLTGLAGDELAKAEFDRDPKLQSAYGGDVKAYIADKKYTDSHKKGG